MADNVTINPGIVITSNEISGVQDKQYNILESDTNLILSSTVEEHFIKDD